MDSLKRALKNAVQSVLGKFGYRLKNIRRIEDEHVKRFDLKPDEIDGMNRETRQVLNLIKETKSYLSHTGARVFEAGYHSLNLEGHSFKGHRDCASRASVVPFDFKDKTVLDIGCNAGGMLFELAPVLKHGVGIDYDAGQINVANRIRSVKGTQNVDFYVFDLELDNLERFEDFLPGGKADVVFLLAICRWVKTWRSVIEHSRKISDCLLLETHGSEAEHEMQLEYAKLYFPSVQELPLNEDERRLFLCKAK